MPPSDRDDEQNEPNPEEELSEFESEDIDEDGPEQPEEEVQELPTRYRVEILEDQYRSLETFIALTISALIILSLGLNWYLFKQTRMARASVHQQKQYVTVIQKEFEKRAVLIREFIDGLEGYAKSDPEFQRVLNKYRKELGRYYSSSSSSTAESGTESDE